MSTISINERITPIIFNGGSYGHFVAWCLCYFSGKTDCLPFNETGSSHLFTDTDFKLHGLIKIHPKFTNDTYKDHVLAERIDNIAAKYGSGILLYANYDLFVLNINNKFDKIFHGKGGWLGHVESMGPDMANNLKKWQVDNLDNMQQWQIREFLSYFIWKQHEKEIEIDTILRYHNDNIVKIDIKRLINEFQVTIEHLLDYCNFTKTRSNFEEIYELWIKLQTHIYKDQIVESIIKNVINNNDFDWSDKNLSIVDEAIIQFKLRDLHKLDLKCYDLNEFPTSTKDLRKYLEPI